MQTRSDAPLEKLLESLAATKGQEFPNRGVNYFERYKQIKQHLATKYYQATGTGLAAGGHRFTKHDITHVDDVIHKAGQILGVPSEGIPFTKLSPYEVFVLLYAIILHDAGNAYQRAGHEARAFKILVDMGDLSGVETVEKQLIASIAQAHGGKARDGDRNTIGKIVKQDVSGIDGLNVHGRRLAAIVRMADELAENPRRADEIALEQNCAVKQAFLPNYYCKTINTNIDSTSHAVSVKYIIMRSELCDKYPDPENNNEETYIVDYIRKRLQKTDLERRYCNRFLYGFAPVDIFRASLEIYDSEYTVVEEIELELHDTGYPTADRSLKDKCPRFDGQVLCDSLLAQTVQEKNA
ncbi:HD domain-containing protein [Sinorhizobium meliloti]|uniref:HD domain-containing protein n=1 Tax=Rhizobium meliloti TaxID=382 RepID=UPI0020902CB9|nr:hypothetical protein [Sinorhizobium meliloti]MCO5966098.1 hypothetical protein [Sinorhizobium meliloti]